MDQVLQVVGAVLILAAYTLAQTRRIDVTSYPYMVTNLVGAALLAVLALIERQWGFLLLEAVWAVVSLVAIVGRLRGRAAPTGH